MSASNFRDLEGWNKARDLTLDVYKLTADRPLEKDFGLRDQMRRAAVSICSNIAEGKNAQKFDQVPGAVELNAIAKHVNSNWHLAPSLLCLKDWHFLVPHTPRLAPEFT